MPKFVKGQSGNPAGRPKGSKNKAAELRATIERDMPEVIAAIVKAAKNGDMRAAGLLLNKCLPNLATVSPGYYDPNPLEGLLAGLLGEE